MHDCETSKLGKFTPPASVKGLKPVCYVKSNKDGQFVFPSLSPGQYTLVPFYQHDSSVKIDIQPATLSFNVAHDSVTLDTTFQVNIREVILWFKKYCRRDDIFERIGATAPKDGLNLYESGNKYRYHWRATFKVQ
jgi:hypothetical protein